MSEGRVYLVGAGPGDPGLLTLRGRQLLSLADVVLYDHLVSPRLLDYAPAEAERIYVGKHASLHTLSRQEEINQLLVDRARKGATVVRLKGGDPFVFGRGGEEALALAQAGVEFELVPGVTAAVAAAAYAGIPVTHRNMASNLGLVTGHEAEEKQGSALDWHALARWKGTLAFYMGMENLGSICQRLVDEGLKPDTPAAVIRWGTTPRQQVVTGTVAALPDLAQDFGPPALIIIGSVVKLRERLIWFERRPLFGRRIVVTRPRGQARGLTSRLEMLGAEVIELPTIRIEPAEGSAAFKRAVRDLSGFDWVIFTSVNGVEAFFAALGEAGLDSRALASNRICVIGPATAKCLGSFGLRPDLQPTSFTSSAIVETLAGLEDLRGRRILCPRADIAPPDLSESLAAQGAHVCNLPAYRVVAEESSAVQVGEMLANDEIHWLTFTSSSTVKNFFSALDVGVIRCSSVRIASIGPKTSATVCEFGLEPAAEADPHTIGGLIDAITKWEKSALGSS